MIQGASHVQPAVLLALLALFLGTLAPPAGSVEVAGLYAASAPVEGRAEPQRQAALSTALRQVFSKVSGERNPAVFAGVAEAARRPGRFVQSFSFATVPPDPLLGTEESLRLDVSFDPTLVDDTLREAGLAVWGRVRPAVVVWSAAELAGRRELLGGEDESGLTEVIDRTAAARGIPVVHPLLDLEDRSRLAVTDVWGGFREVVMRASERYGSDAVLVGRIYPLSPALWEARWRLLLGGATHDWSSTGDQPEVAVEEGIHGAADRLASEFARVGTQAGASGVELMVSDVNSVEDYGRTLGYLESLDLVKRVDVLRVDGDRLRLRLDTRGGGEALVQVIALGRTLAPTGAGAAGLGFRLLP